MVEDHIVLLVALPFVSIILVTFVNLLHNPVGTIQGLYKFILKIGNKTEDQE